MRSDTSSSSVTIGSALVLILSLNWFSTPTDTDSSTHPSVHPSMSDSTEGRVKVCDSTHQERLETAADDLVC